MIDKAKIKTILLDNFNDDRIGAIHLFLDMLIKRDIVPGGGVPTYRLYDKNKGDYIQSFNEFLTAITEAGIVPNYDFYTTTHTGDKTHPMFVVLSNFEVHVASVAGDKLDTWLLQTYGNSKQPTPGFPGYKKNLGFSLNYLSDADPVLPIKVFEVKLT